MKRIIIVLTTTLLTCLTMTAGSVFRRPVEIEYHRGIMRSEVWVVVKFEDGSEVAMKDEDARWLSGKLSAHYRQETRAGR